VYYVEGDRGEGRGLRPVSKDKGRFKRYHLETVPTPLRKAAILTMHKEMQLTPQCVVVEESSRAVLKTV
jgi:hypothetical protein